MRYRSWFFAAVVLCGVVNTHEAQAQSAGVELICPSDASVLMQFAAKEVRRYVYVRTNAWLPIVAESSAKEQIRLAKDAALAEQAYRLKTEAVAEGRRVCTLSGGSDVAVLYAAYRFAEVLGVRFFLHGDTIPDAKIPLHVPDLDENHAPLFALRGIQPFHDFPEGPDWWSTDHYRAIVSQLPKLRMNFIGLHTYPEDRPAAEPTTWIGRPEEVNADGTVQAAYPAIYYNTALPVGWGYQPKPTSEYACGGAALFDRDDYGSDIMRGLTPRPEKPEDCNEVFHRAGAMFNEVFSLARDLGVKTCIGTETPLVVPKQVAARFERPALPIQAEGGNVAHFSAPVADTEDDALFQHVRYGMSAYRCVVPNGTYTVILYFNEPHYDAAGARVFGVAIEGQPAIERLDVFEKAGKNRAIVQTFEGIAVADGRLDIEFQPIVEFPCIAAIAISGEGGTWKINCGGPAHADFLGEDSVSGLTSEQIKKLYEGLFARIQKTHPLDYYWIWTPENWTWENVSKEVVESTINDIRIAYDALKASNAPFQMATCGWVLGPQYDRSYLDSQLPKEISVSCINRSVGHEPVEPGFANVAGRGKWAIPWLEDDPAMSSPQLWVGRMRRDARDALAYGCDGLMGIHWRTRILGPNVSALAQAAWQQSGWSSDAERGPGVGGGVAVGNSQNVIRNTVHPQLYRTIREGMTGYHIALPNGAYRVLLQFCDRANREPGKRVFSVRMEGKEMLRDLDIAAEAGQHVALDRAFENIAVEDGLLDIDFSKKIGEPIISAIAVEGAGGTVKIDCGGPGVEGYGQDLKTISPHPYPLDFYTDWVASNFGVADAGLAVLFSRIDGQVPRASDWIGGPGGYRPDPRPWKDVQADYAFVDELASYRDKIAGAGNLERFDYWLHTFRYLRATAKMKCAWFDFDTAYEKVKKERDPARKRGLLRENVLSLRVELAQTASEVIDEQLATVTTTGAMGTICNLEQHTFPIMLGKPGKEIEDLLGVSLSAEAWPRRAYAGSPRIVVTAERADLKESETFEVRAAMLDSAPAKEMVLCWRTLGVSGAEFQRVPMALQARQTYSARVESAQITGNDFEYYIEAISAGGENARWPVSAPEINNTVVIMPGKGTA